MLNVIAESRRFQGCSHWGRSLRPQSILTVPSQAMPEVRPPREEVGDRHKTITSLCMTVLWQRCLKWQFGSEFDVLHRDFGLDALHALDTGQVIDLELPVIVQIARDDAQQEIAIPRHQMAFHDLR